MTTLKFKTNIKCGGCIANVTPFLNQVPEIVKWEVDTTNPDKVLTVEAGSDVTQQIVDVIHQAGYEATKA